MVFMANGYILIVDMRSKGGLLLEDLMKIE